MFIKLTRELSQVTLNFFCFNLIMIDALRIVPADGNVANDTMTAELLGTLIKA